MSGKSVRCRMELANVGRGQSISQRDGIATNEGNRVLRWRRGRLCHPIDLDPSHARLIRASRYETAKKHNADSSIVQHITNLTRLMRRQKMRTSGGARDRSATIRYK